MTVLWGVVAAACLAGIASPGGGIGAEEGYLDYLHSHEVEDLDGDGVPDLLIGAPAPLAGGPGWAEIQYSSADSVTVQGAPDDEAFGWLLGSAEAGVGTAPIVVASFGRGAEGRFRLWFFDGDGSLLGMSELSSESDSPAPAWLAGDADADGALTTFDVGLMSTMIGLHVDSMALRLVDLDGSGAIDGVDISIAVDRVALQNWSGLESIVQMVEGVESLIDMTSDPGSLPCPLPSDGVTPEPSPCFLACTWCAIKCRLTMKKAWKCVSSAKEAVDACLEECRPQDCYRCYQLRAEFIRSCLKDIAETAGKCANCITRCGPGAR